MKKFMLGLGYWDIATGAAFLNHNITTNDLTGSIIDLFLIGIGAYFIATN
jgi:hypothetical protein